MNKKIFFKNTLISIFLTLLLITGTILPNTLFKASSNEQINPSSSTVSYESSDTSSLPVASAGSEISASISPIAGSTPVQVAVASIDAIPDINADTFVSEMTVGWNLGNSLDSHYGDPTGDGNLSQETIWGNPKISQELIDYVSSLGFNTIRIPVSWYYHTYTDENGSLKIHPDWINRVKEVVDYCIANDMYVILNSHHDGMLFHVGVSDEEYTVISNNVKVIWSQIAETFKDYDNHLIFEPYNEVDNYEKYFDFGKKAARQMNSLNQIFVDTIRSTGGNNSTRILMVPTLLHNSGKQFINAYELPTDTVPNCLVVSVHCYPGAYDQQIESELAPLEKFSQKIGAPVVIDEWGTSKKYSPEGFRTVHASNFVARSLSHNLKCVYWDNGSSYAIIDRKTLTCDEAMIYAILNPAAYDD